jgi:hypothetical protein
LISDHQRRIVRFWHEATTLVPNENRLRRAAKIARGADHWSFMSTWPNLFVAFCPPFSSQKIHRPSTPRAIVDKIQREVVKMYVDPTIAEKLEKLGVCAGNSTPRNSTLSCAKSWTVGVECSRIAG